MHIAKSAIRQGCFEEKMQLDICAQIASQRGVHIKNLSATAFRPTKDGRIINNTEAKKIPKNDCLKSFDAKITGKITGWIFAKVVFGNGGAQDNVFEEAYTFCEWVQKYGNSDDIYVVLIDTDLEQRFKILKNKFHEKNLLVVNHRELQEYFIQNVPSLDD